MTTFRRILVGIELQADGREVCPGSHEALHAAKRLAHEFGASVELFHSTHRRSSPDAAKHTLDRLATECRDARLNTSLRFGEERAWIDMIRVVLKDQIDLVVVGKRSRREVHDGIHLGSVATKLLRKCPAPVLVVDPTDDLRYRRILAATDFSRVGERAVELAASLVERFDAELHVVHAYQLPFELQIEEHRVPQEKYEADRRKRLEECQAEIMRELVTSGLTRSPVLHVTCDRPSHAILRAIDESKADLLVMGTLSQTRLAGLLVGHTAERLLPRVSCSVLAVKPTGFVSPIQA